MATQSMFSKICSSEDSKTVIGVTVGVAAAVGAGYLCYRHIVNTPPKKWRQVGELTDLIYYPVKSCGPIRARELQCTQLGLNDNGLGDRTFMIVTPENRFITARQQPKTVQIHPRYENQKLILTAPMMPEITVDFEAIKNDPSTRPIKTVIWGQSVDTIECGPEVEKWLSQFILGADTGLRLVYYYKMVPTRPVAKENRKFPVTSADRGGLHDETSFMLLNEASIADINSKVDHDVTALQFRPNFLVKGPAAFEEDNWKWIRIGDVVFKYCQPCLRCVFTTIDPELAVRNPQGEPLKTLKSYRKVDGFGPSPVFGTHFGVHAPGVVKLGDPIFVGEK